MPLKSERYVAPVSASPRLPGVYRSIGRGRKMAVPLSPLAAIDAGESTDEAIGDWHYWVAQGCIL